MRYSSRFFLYAPFAGLLLLAAIAMIHWWLDARALASYLDAANGHEIMPGVRMSFAEKRLAGFPFRLDTVLKDLRLEVADVSGPIVWTSENFAMHRLTYGRVQAILEAAGQQTLTWMDAQGSKHRFAFLPGTFRASAILDHGKLIRFDSEIADLDGQDFRAANAQLHARTMLDGLDVYFKLQNAHVTGGYAAAFGSEISSLIVSGHMDHGEALRRLLRGDEAPRAALDGWRNVGGSIGVSELLAPAGPFGTLDFKGKLTLDSTHDLSGTLIAHNGSTLNFTRSHIGRLDGLP